VEIILRCSEVSKNKENKEKNKEKDKEKDKEKMSD